MWPFGISTQLPITSKNEGAPKRSLGLARDGQEVITPVCCGLPLSHVSNSIVFSFWTATLDLAGAALDQAHISYTRVDGTMLAKQRQLALESFVEDSRIRTILISLRCGSTGYVKGLYLRKYPSSLTVSRLILTAANHVFLMEPQWNPMIEDQALDRVHRIGQTKEVTTVRYIVNNTLEEVRQN